MKHGYMVESEDAWRDAWFRSMDDADRWVNVLRSDDVRRICVYACRHDGGRSLVYEIAR